MSDSDDVKEKRKTGERIFRPVLPRNLLIGTIIGLIIIAGLLYGVTHLDFTIKERTVSSAQTAFVNTLLAICAIPGMLITAVAIGLPFMLHAPQWRQHIMVSEEGLAWFIDGWAGKTTWDNLELLFFREPGRHDGYGIQFHQAVTVTRTGKSGDAEQKNHQYLPIQPYIPWMLSARDDVYLLRTNLGSALYRHAPHIFTRLDDKKKKHAPL